MPRWRAGLNLVGRAVAIVMLLVASVALLATHYKQTHFADTKIQEVVFYLANGVERGETSIFTNAAIAYAPAVVALFLLLCLPLLPNLARRRIRLLGHHLPLGLSRLRHQLGYALTVFAVSLGVLLSSFQVGSYLYAQANPSTFYESSFTNPKDVSLTFPAVKRNLIYIYLESFENTLAARGNGGQAEVSVIRPLEELALDPNNVHFSHRRTGLGGPLETAFATWTTGGIVAQSAGLPVVSDLFNQPPKTADGRPLFLPGATTLGDELNRAGYQQSFIMGSDAAFGARDQYLSQHGGYHIIDHPYALANGLLPPGHHRWWGFLDSHVYQFARAEATRLAKKGEPFNLQLLTSITHFPSGIMDDNCREIFGDRYDNVYNCSAEQTADFIAWATTQPWFGNTTIVVSGDHLGMQTDYYAKLATDPSFERTTFNVIINPAVRPAVSQDRTFSAFDLYPTTLAALGVRIPGDRLAFGTNLFSATRTLPEQMGMAAFNTEVSRTSPWYRDHIAAKP